MTVNTYSSLPSNAIDRVVIDTEANTVEVSYKSNNEKSYKYSTEDAQYFEVKFLAEFDNIDIGSVGKLINESVNNGTLQLVSQADVLVETTNQGVTPWDNV